MGNDNNGEIRCTADGNKKALEEAFVHLVHNLGLGNDLETLTCNSLKKPCANSVIQIRILFRLVQFSSGTSPSNRLVSSEAYFYLLEAVPMVTALLSFNVVHPGTVLKGPESEMPGFFATIKAKCFRRRGVKGIEDSLSATQLHEVTK